MLSVLVVQCATASQKMPRIHAGHSRTSKLIACFLSFQHDRVSDFRARAALVLLDIPQTCKQDCTHLHKATHPATKDNSLPQRNPAFYMPVIKIAREKLPSVLRTGHSHTSKLLACFVSFQHDRVSDFDARSALVFLDFTPNVACRPG